MEVEDIAERESTSVADQGLESDGSTEETGYEQTEEDVGKTDETKKLEEYESDLLSEHDMNIASDEDTESLTGSLDGATTGGDEYELTGDDTEYNSDPVTKHTRQEKQRMLALRRHLDLLSEQVVQNDYLVTQSREELKKCHENIQSLETELDKTAKEIESVEIDQNKASLFRLKSHYKKLCTEIESEQQVAEDITERLEKAEYLLSVATMEQGRFLLAGEELEKQEEIEKKNKAEISAGRIRKENMNVMSVEKRRRIREKDHITALRERERKHRQALATAKRNREQASKFLKETMTRVRRKEAEDEEFHRVDMEKRIQNLLSLKANIENNKENLRAVEARAAHLRGDEERKEKEEEEEILNEGLNPDEVLTRRKRIRQFEKDKEAFEKRQRERQIEIADKLLREEKQMKKRYQQQPQMWPEKQRDRNKRLGRRRPKSKALKVYSGSSSMEYSADAEDAGGTGFVPSKLIPVSSDDEDEFSPFGHTSRDEQQEGDSDNDGEDLAEPEFKGLWEEENRDEKEKTSQKLKFTNNIPSKMEQDMMEKALTTQKENIVQKQIAVGREFKGQAFYSKPETVVFKDFDIGKTYRKKVVLTNVSYTQNFCKYIGMSNHLMDFIDVLYDPPGAMSAGLTCDFTVTFKPMLKEDLVGQFDFLAQTGPFSVPVKCLTKRCQISVDKSELNFGGQVLGETCKKSVVLVNEGALGTTFQIKKILDGVESEPSLDLESISDTASMLNAGTQRENVEGEQQFKEKRKESKTVVQNLETVHEQDSSTMDSTPSSRQQQLDDQDEQGSSIVQDEQDAPVVPPSQSVFTVRKLASYDVAPFSSVQIEIIFAPTKPGDITSDFEVTFSDDGSLPITITAHGTGVDLPVWVERELVDLKICMYDRLYQDAIVVNNRATSALRLKLEVCKELRDHLELLPKTAYIQAESQFSAQLKFLPRRSLMQDCPTYFDSENGVLEAPMVIRVGDQTRPVCFTVRAVVTAADIEFNVQEVDFGYCTITESVKQTITMTNKSILPQLYGFCGVPQCLEVQPNDGFGTLLPLESLDIDLIFSARKAKEYSVELNCKNGIGTEYRIPCKGIGVYPPLGLSQSVISFRATAMDDSSTTSLSVVNSHIDSNEFTHEVPRIGRGPVAEVGPTSFEFVVPADAPLNISPAVGVVMPGERCSIEVTLNPCLETSLIKREGLRIVEKMAERKRKTSEENVAKEKPEEVVNAGKRRLAKGGKKSGKGSPKRGQTPSAVGIRRPPTPAKTNSVEDIVEGSDEFCAAKLSLLKSFENTLSSYDIPCFVASGQSSEPGSLTYSPHNTLYLKVHCPVVRPDIVVISNNGRSSLDFDQASVGQRVVKDITIQNISPTTVALSSSLLDPHGPFELLNATRSLQPDATHSCVISFSPGSPHEFYEVLDLHSSRSTLHTKLQGKGVKPVVCSSVEDGILDFGYALVKDSATMAFKLENTSELVVKFNILLASLTTSNRQVIPAYLASNQQDLVVGSSNYHGAVVFDCVPSCGSIEPGKSQEFTVAFTADHSSDCYADELRIEINNTITERVRLRARATTHIVYLQGWDEFSPNEESLSEIIHEEEEGIPQKLVFLLFKSHSKRGEAFSAAERHVEIGCIKSNLSTKRSCEFVFDNTKEANEKGFSFDPAKGSVDLGHKKQLTCRWQPAADQDPTIVVNCCTVITVKSEVTIQYKVLLRGMIVSD